MSALSTLRKFAVLAAFMSQLVFAQGKPPGGGGKPTALPPSIQPPSQVQPNLQANRQIVVISGKVLFESGIASPEPIRIEKICGTSKKLEGFTDSKGNFQIQLGQETSAMQDASESSSEFNSHFASAINPSFSNGVLPRELMGCELRASYPGFESSTIPLEYQPGIGQWQVGTIMLRPLGGATGTTISLTTLKAPKEAREAYQKAKQLLAKNKIDDAEKHLLKAVTIDAQFASAWYLLGSVHQHQNRVDEAFGEYSKALGADPDFVSPYLGLTQIALSQKRWRDAAQSADHLLKMNSFAFPVGYWYNALANFYLNNLSVAETNVRKFLPLDPDHREPDATLLLSHLLALKGDYAGAATEDRSYLQALPNSAKSEAVRADLKHLEGLQAATPK